MHRVQHKYFDSSTSTREEFLLDIIIENLPLEEEESIHPTGRDISISGFIQSDRVLEDLFLVITNKSYFRKSTGSTKAGVLADKFICPNNIWDTPDMCEHDTHFSGVCVLVSVPVRHVRIMRWQGLEQECSNPGSDLRQGLHWP